MSDRLLAKEKLLAEVSRHDEKYQLSKTVGPDYYEPGMMENLDQYLGEYDEVRGIIKLRTEVKGLRYDNRTQRLDFLSVGDSVKIVRDESNLYNTNNFAVQTENGESLGSLSAELCNAIAPLFDMGYAVIEYSIVSYLEKIRQRSRYAKQGVLFLEIIIRLRGLQN